MRGENRNCVKHVIYYLMDVIKQTRSTGHVFLLNVANAIDGLSRCSPWHRRHSCSRRRQFAAHTALSLSLFLSRNLFHVSLVALARRKLERASSRASLAIRNRGPFERRRYILARLRVPASVKRRRKRKHAARGKTDKRKREKVSPATRRCSSRARGTRVSRKKDARNRGEESRTS